MKKISTSLIRASNEYYKNTTNSTVGSQMKNIAHVYDKITLNLALIINKPYLLTRLSAESI